MLSERRTGSWVFREDPTGLGYPGMTRRMCESSSGLKSLAFWVRGYYNVLMYLAPRPKMKLNAHLNLNIVQSRTTINLRLHSKTHSLLMPPLHLPRRFNPHTIMEILPYLTRHINVPMILSQHQTIIDTHPRTGSAACRTHHPHGVITTPVLRVLLELPPPPPKATALQAKREYARDIQFRLSLARILQDHIAPRRLQ